MTTTIDGIPGELATADLQRGAVHLSVDASVYPLEALYGASYIFIDRCYVLVDRPDTAHFRVTLAAKKGTPDEDALRLLVGEFANELLACAWRHQITLDNRAIIETVTSAAIAGAMGPPSLDDLASFDFSDEPFEDPLGIAMSWEEKYKKDKPAAPVAADAGSTPTEAKPADDGAEKSHVTTELRLHRDVYDGRAVDEAVKTYVRFATFELAEETEHWLVRITAKSSPRETQLAGEVGNYALGLTIRARGRTT